MKLFFSMYFLLTMVMNVTVIKYLDNTIHNPVVRYPIELALFALLMVILQFAFKVKGRLRK